MKLQLPAGLLLSQTGAKTPSAGPAGGQCPQRAPARGAVCRWLATEPHHSTAGGRKPEAPGHFGDRAGPGAGRGMHLGVWPAPGRHSCSDRGVPERWRRARRRVADALRDGTGHG